MVNGRGALRREGRPAHGDMPPLAWASASRVGFGTRSVGSAARFSQPGATGQLSFTRL